MIIGVPREIKSKENRVAITPYGVRHLVKNNHTVYVEKSAGANVGFTDDNYKAEGAIICDNAEDIYKKAEIIVKVQAPQSSEYKLLNKNQILFSSLHLDINRELTKELLNKKIISISYEAVQSEDGKLPLLIPMSEIAGKMSIQVASNLLQNNNNSSGILLSGVAGVPSGKVLIVGAGTAGYNAAKLACGIGADVYVTDIDIEKLREIEEKPNLNIKTFLLNEAMLLDITKEADVVICAVLARDKKLPIVITEEMVKGMRKGSVIIDISIDQGGVVETMDRITTIDNPTFEKYGVIHYSVENMPSCVARTATIAMTNASMRYLEKIAEVGIINAIKDDLSLARGVTTFNGKITNKKIASLLNLDYTEISGFIGF